MFATFDTNVPGLADLVCSFVRDTAARHRWCDASEDSFVCNSPVFEPALPGTLQMFYDTPLVASVADTSALSRTLLDARHFVNFLYIDHRLDNARLRVLAENMRRMSDDALDRLVLVCSADTLADGTYLVVGADRCSPYALAKALAAIIDSYLVHGHATSASEVTRDAVRAQRQRAELPLTQRPDAPVNVAFDIREFVDATCAGSRTADCALCET